MTRTRKTKTTQEIADSLKAIHEKLNALAHKVDTIPPPMSLTKGTRDLTEQAAQSQKILDDIKTHPGAARKEIAGRTHIPATKVTQIVVELQSQERLVRLGSRRTTRWFTPDILGGAVKISS